MLLPPANEVWGKVIFSQASVILFTGGMRGVCVCVVGGMCGKGMCVAVEGGACMAKGVCMVWGACVAGGACMAGEMAIAAGGTHPTGIHSCFKGVCQSFCSKTETPPPIQ